MLEIGPGQGRWTQYLKDRCDELILVDPAEHCVEACRDRSTGRASHRLPRATADRFRALADRSVDLAFSFDSLVHAEADALESYAHELARVLKPDGIAFIHHSNMAACALGPHWRV